MTGLTLRKDVTAYFIVKNEDKWIRASIESAKRHMDNILVVDTGSEDNTVAEVKRTGVRLIEHPKFDWELFSKVKNHYADTEINTDLLLYIDGNEIITDKGFRALNYAVKNLDFSDMSSDPSFSLPQYEVVGIKDVDDRHVQVEYYDKPTGRRRLCSRHRVCLRRGFGRAILPRKEVDDKAGMTFSYHIVDTIGMFWHMRFMGQSSLDGNIVDHMHRTERNSKARKLWDAYPKKTIKLSKRQFTGD
jgi:glycosyltransferase involved in cell wall biosynthesis